VPRSARIQCPSLVGQMCQPGSTPTQIGRGASPYTYVTLAVTVTYKSSKALAPFTQTLTQSQRENQLEIYLPRPPSSGRYVFFPGVCMHVCHPSSPSPTSPRFCICFFIGTSPLLIIFSGPRRLRRPGAAVQCMPHLPVSPSLVLPPDPSPLWGVVSMP
jgi:hypothetical protein